MLTYILFKTQGMLLSTKAGKTRKMLTYKLFKIQSMLLSAISWMSQLDVDLHTIQKPEYALVSIRGQAEAKY